jgi:hypothetical protein
LARRDESINDGATPVILFLELRAYARDCELQPRSIRDYLTDLIKSQYQVDIPGSTLEYLLTAGRLGVAFDGLDELPVVAQRRTIRDSIEAFATRYSLAPIIVTSRLVGYEHAALSLDSFNHLQLASFDNEQVEEYAALWFSVDGRYSDADLDRTVEAFISESLSAPDLRVNPLMLGLMCVLYRGQGYIPRNRPELYRQCATFLFETWDRHRGIVTEKPFERLVRPALRELAYWIYTNPNLQRGVPYEAAIRKTTKFLVDLDFGDEILAEDAARSFIDFCRGRAWVFTDVGTDASDRDVFAFTHRTFLEFFTAERILDRTETTGALLRVLRPRIYAAEWDVVPQLAIQIHEERHLRSADKCLKQLIETAPDAMSRSNALGFDVRALQAVIPSPSTTGEIVAAVFEELGTAYNYYRSSIKAGQTPDPGPLQTAQDMFLGLFRCDAEARTAVADAIQAALARWLALGPKDELAVLACELALSGHLVAEDALRLSISEQRVWWMERLHRLADSLEGSLTAITLALPSCAALRCAVGRSDISDLVSTHGIPGLFWTPRATLHMHALHSAAQQILTGNARSDDATAVGTTLCAAPTPWISEHVLGGLVLSWSDFRRTEPAGAGMTASTLLLCALVEPALDGPQHPSSWPGIALLDSVNEGLMSDLRAEERALTLAERILLARGEPDEADEMRGELHAAGYEPACIEALEGWIRRDISFVRRES